MSEQQHPITPPPELVQQWINEEHGIFAEHIATQAARWGWQQRHASVPEELQKARDTELDACCEWLSVPCPSYGRELRTAMRPKPPSLAEQGLELVDRIEKAESVWNMRELDTIRRSLERLQELENNG